MNENIWEQAPSLTLRDINRPVPLRNFAGRNYMAYVDSILVVQLGIGNDDRVLDIGGGATPFSRSDVVTDAYLDDDTHRIGQSIPEDKTYVQCFVEDQPFEDDEFDVAVSRHVVEHSVDPEAACKEIARVARRGYIEVPSPWSEYFYGYPPHRWLISVEDGVLVFRRRPFVRSPFLNCLRWMEYRDSDFTFRWNLEYRNLITTQFPWEGEVRCRVEADHGFDYDDPEQAAESHVSFVLNALRFGGVPPEVLEYEARAAVRFRPDFALAHNTLGIVLLMAKRHDESAAAFAEAHRLEPGDEVFHHNSRLPPGSGQPRIRLLPPEPVDTGLPPENFAGKLFCPPSNEYDLRLAERLNIQDEEKVLDINNGGHFFERANVTAGMSPEPPTHYDGRIEHSSDRFVYSESKTLPFPDASFDVVTMRGVLERVNDPSQLCSEIQRVAKRGFLEVPSLYWEYMFGNPRNRWLFDIEDGVLVIRRKPFAKIPFKSVIVPLLLKYPELRQRFEVSFRNLTFVQLPWDGRFEYRVEDDPACPYDYHRPVDALLGHLDYAFNLCNQGAPSVALPEVDAALAIEPAHPDSLNMRGVIAWALGRQREGLDYVRRAAELAPQNQQIAENYRFMREKCSDM